MSACVFSLHDAASVTRSEVVQMAHKRDEQEAERRAALRVNRRVEADKANRDHLERDAADVAAQRQAQDFRVRLPSALILARALVHLHAGR